MRSTYPTARRPGPAGAAGVAATLVMLVAVMAGCTAASDAAAPHPTSTVTSCPATIDTTNGSPHATRTGPLVPDGATTAVLCFYPPVGNDGIYPLAESQPSQIPANEVVATLNALTARTELRSGPDETPVDACAAMARTAFVILLTYPGGGGVTATIEPNCGSVESTGAVADTDRLSSLLAAWPGAAVS